MAIAEPTPLSTRTLNRTAYCSARFFLQVEQGRLPGAGWRSIGVPRPVDSVLTEH